MRRALDFIIAGNKLSESIAREFEILLKVIIISSSDVDVKKKELILKVLLGKFCF